MLERAINNAPLTNDVEVRESSALLTIEEQKFIFDLSQAHSTDRKGYMAYLGITQLDCGLYSCGPQVASFPGFPSGNPNG